MNFDLCRLCYEREATLNIFRTESPLLVTKIVYCCESLKVVENDGLPENICSDCERELEACFQFLQKCETSDKKLRALLAPCPTSQAQLAEFVTKTEVKNEDIDIDEVQLFPSESLEADAFQSEVQEQFETLNSKKQRKKRIKSAKEDVSCSICNRRCASASALAAHMRTHTDERPFQCAACHKKYKDSGTLRRHTERNHLLHRERRFICENCGKGFYSKNDITIHMRVHTRETPYSCPVCYARFTQISAMLRHKKRHTEEKSHTCSTCSKSFWTKEELKKHYSVHNDVRHFKCPICNVQFKQKSNIKKHMAVHADPNRYECNHCGKTFNVKGNLKSHIDRKHSEKSGYCNICSKNVSNIENHTWKHTGQRPLQCEFCPSSFCELRSLALHINFKHKKTDRFKCSMEGCTLGFPSKPMMMYHIARFHEMQTPYSCDRCPRGFYRKNDLSRHKIGTHKERLI